MNTTEFLKILPAYSGAKMKFNISSPYYKFICLIADDEGTEWNTIYYLSEHGSLLQNITKVQFFKLVLRSFDQITDEEKLQLKIIRKDKSGLPTDPENWSSNYVIYKITKDAKEINYLRSIGIDCDGILESPFGIKESEK